MELSKFLASARNEYTFASLDENSCDPDPMRQFQMWLSEIIDSKIKEPNAMVLSTQGNDKAPSQRIVLLKGLEKNGFIFFTHYLSRKGKEIESNPYGSLLFSWIIMERQVIVKGMIKKCSREVSEKYFYNRPRSSQLSTLISEQSKKVQNREILEKKLKAATQKYAQTKVPMPKNWGGYLLQPFYYEFWQGRPERLHDRIIYEYVDDWKISRLSP